MTNYFKDLYLGIMQKIEHDYELKHITKYNLELDKINQELLDKLPEIDLSLKQFYLFNSKEETNKILTQRYKQKNSVEFINSKKNLEHKIK